MPNLLKAATRALQATPSPVNRKQYISEGEVQDEYGIPRKTLRNWRVLGRGPEYRKFGGAVRYNVVDLEKWIESLPRGGAGIPASAIKEESRRETTIGTDGAA